MIGKMIAKSAAENLTPCLLELGGKSPMIVDESADIEFAAWKAALWGFFNSGQTCIRPDYVLIHSSKTDEFIKYLTKAMDEWYKEGQNKDNLG